MDSMTECYRYKPSKVTLNVDLDQTGCGIFREEKPKGLGPAS